MKVKIYKYYCPGCQSTITVEVGRVTINGLESSRGCDINCPTCNGYLLEPYESSLKDKE